MSDYLSYRLGVYKKEKEKVGGENYSSLGSTAARASSLELTK